MHIEVWEARVYITIEDSAYSYPDDVIYFGQLFCQIINSAWFETETHFS